MRGVARLAHVSVATVSNVINNTRYVSPELRFRVLEAIAHTGYRPNPVARGLRTKRTGLIAVVIPDVRNPYYPELARGAQDSAEEECYHVLLYNSDRSLQKEMEFVLHVSTGSVDGLILYASTDHPDLVDLLHSISLPVVLIGPRIESECCDKVMMSAIGTHEPVRHLAELGHKRIGLIYGRSVQRSNPPMRTGYLRMMDRCGLPVDDRLVIDGSYTIESGYECMQSLLDVQPRPTAVSAANDLVAIGAMRAAKDRGLGVPEEVSVVGFDDIAVGEVSDPPLTTVHVPKYELGREAASLLIRRLKGDDVAQEHIVLDHTFVIRGSTAAPRQRAGP